jgi:L-fucose mutarotase
MLTSALIHPPLLAALANCGHGSQILIADGNFPYATVIGPNAAVVHLNVRPGMLTVDEVLHAVRSTVNFEAATVMSPPQSLAVPAHDGYRDALGAAVPVTGIDRFVFYDAVRSADVGLVIATGDQRAYANLLLTIGVAAAIPAAPASTSDSVTQYATQ